MLAPKASVLDWLGPCLCRVVAYDWLKEVSKYRKSLLSPSKFKADRGSFGGRGGAGSGGFPSTFDWGLGPTAAHRGGQSLAGPGLDGPRRLSR